MLVAGCGARETPDETGGSGDPAQAARRDVELQREMMDGVMRAAPDCRKMEAFVRQHHAVHGGDRVRLWSQHRSSRVYHDARRDASSELIRPMLSEFVAAQGKCQDDDFLTAMTLVSDPSGVRRCHVDAEEFVREPAAAREDASSTTPAPPRVVDQRDIERRRIRGNRQIFPDDEEQEAMAATGLGTVAVAKLCLGEDGLVSRVSIIKSSCFPRYDAKLKAEMGAWQYRPYELDGRPVPVCMSVTIMYRPR